MATRLPPLLDRAILFTHRRERARAHDDTLALFERALRFGVTGIHVEVWATHDEQLVLGRSGMARRFPPRRIRDTDFADLPTSFVRVDDLYDSFGSDLTLSVWVDDETSGSSVVRVARAHGAAESLWLAHHDLEVLASWRDDAPEIRLVNSTTVDELPFGAERRAAELAAARIDAVSLPESDWSGGLVTLFHRFEVFAMSRGAHYEHQLARLIDMGIDAVAGEHPERMAAVAATFD